MENKGISEYFSESMTFFKENVGMLCLFGFFLYMIPSMLISSLDVYSQYAPPSMSIMIIVGTIAMTILSSIMGNLFYAFILTIYKLRRQGVKDYLHNKGFSGALRSFLWIFIYNLIILILLVTIGIPGVLIVGVLVGMSSVGSMAFAILLGVFFFIGGVILYIWIMVRLLFVVYSIVHDDVNTFVAIGNSWEFTKGKFWRILGYIAVFMLALVGFFIIIMIPFGLLTVMTLSMGITANLISSLSQSFVTSIVIMLYTIIASAFFYSVYDNERVNDVVKTVATSEFRDVPEEVKVAPVEKKVE